MSGRKVLLLHRIVKEYLGTTELRTEMLRSLLKIVMIKLSRRMGAHCLPEAKRQASWEGMSLKQIAYRLGFDDFGHFSKFFKKTAASIFPNSSGFI
jgi:AraC family transcriptional activator of pobA